MLPEDTPVIETARAKLDCSVLQTLAGTEIMASCLDLPDMNVEMWCPGRESNPQALARGGF